MKKCQQCGAPLQDDDRFCQACGAEQLPEGEPKKRMWQMGERRWEILPILRCRTAENG